MRNENYLSLINFKVKHHRQRLFLFYKWTLYFHFIQNGGHEAQWFCGGRIGSHHAISILSKGPWLATFADPFNSTIYNQPFFTKRTAATKIPHLLCEKTHLKPWMECMIFFTKNDFIYKNVLCDGDGRKTAKTFTVWLLSHPPFYGMEDDCFSVSKNTENKPDLR